MATTGISSTGTLNAPGVGSGLDVNGMVAKLMAVEQAPLTALGTQEVKFQAKLTSLGMISGALASLQTAAQGLATASTVQHSASAGDATVLTATAATDAIPGKYSVKVNKLAQPQALLAAGRPSTTEAIGSASARTTLTFSFGTMSKAANTDTGMFNEAGFAPNYEKPAVSVVIDSSNNTLAGIRDAINSANAGVTASIVNDGGKGTAGSPYRLAITSKDSGAANSLKIDASGDSAVESLLGYNPATGPTQNLMQTQAARDADLSIDGVAITSASNNVAGAIQGVTLKLTKEATTDVTVQRNTSEITASLNTLIKAYNGLNTAITGPTAKGAVLQGDSAVLGLQRQVASLFGSAQNSGGTYTRLSDLGISFQKDGTLVLNSVKLGTAMAANTADVAALTAALGQAIEKAATGLIGPSGPISAKTGGITQSIKDIGSRRTQVQAHLDTVQKAYQKQFSALDTLVSNMNSTSAFLTQQLDSLTNMLKNK